MSRSTDTANDAGQYLRAAKIMDSPKHAFGCCNAIAKAVNGLGPEGEDGAGDCGILTEEYDVLEQRFSKVFKEGEASLYFWERPPSDRAERVLALCFMAAMVEAGDA